MNRLWCVWLPLFVIYGYRLIPPAVRRLWVRQGSTSGLALAAVRDGGGWEAFWYYAMPVRMGDWGTGD